MIVVDIGCHPQGPEESVHKLCDRYRPEILFGFDPFPDLVEGLECVGETLVVRRRVAAWVWNGTVSYAVDGITSTAYPRFISKPPVDAECFDLAEWLRLLPPVELLLKLDAEGAEFPLLTDLYMKGLDERLSLLLVEWHGDGDAESSRVVRDEMGREALLERLRCPVEDWQ